MIVDQGVYNGEKKLNANPDPFMTRSDILNCIKSIKQTSRDGWFNNNYCPIYHNININMKSKRIKIDKAWMAAI